MTTAQRCPECGTVMGADAPLGVCPKCVLGVMMGGEGATTPYPSAPRDTQATVEGLAGLFPQFEILGSIGRGGMGVVYKARQIKLDRLVALKLIRPESLGDANFAERFAREARAMAKLNHPNIVMVHDFGEVGGLFYLVMELVEGHDLRQALKKGPLKDEAALVMALQICDALQYAHEQGIVHRDIKPENVLLGPDGQVKLADFGLAKLLVPSEVQPLTLTRQVMGTPHYMAPEQLERPRAVDHRADIYALGVVIYEMFTGVLPLGRYELPSEKVGADEQLDEVVTKALARDPDERYARVADLRADLEEFAENYDLTDAWKAAVVRASLLSSGQEGGAGGDDGSWWLWLIPVILGLAFIPVWGQQKFTLSGLPAVSIWAIPYSLVMVFAGFGAATWYWRGRRGAGTGDGAVAKDAAIARDLQLPEGPEPYAVAEPLGLGRVFDPVFAPLFVLNMLAGGAALLYAWGAFRSVTVGHVSGAPSAAGVMVAIKVIVLGTTTLLGILSATTPRMRWIVLLAGVVMAVFSTEAILFGLPAGLWASFILTRGLVAAASRLLHTPVRSSEAAAPVDSAIAGGTQVPGGGKAVL